MMLAQAREFNFNVHSVRNIVRCFADKNIFFFFCAQWYGVRQSLPMAILNAHVQFQID